MNFENICLAGKIISPSYAQQAAEARKGFEHKVRQLLEQVFLFKVVGKFFLCFIGVRSISLLICSMNHNIL